MTGGDGITLGDLHDEIKMLTATLNAYIQQQAPIIAVMQHRLTEVEDGHKQSKRELDERIAGLDQARKESDAAREHERKAVEQQRDEDRKHRRTLTWTFASGIAGSVLLWFLSFVTHIHP